MTDLQELRQVIPPEYGSVLYATRVGSRVYGTARDDSDEDFVVVTKAKRGELFRSAAINIVFKDEESFLQSVNEQSVFALEVWFALPKHQLIPRPKSWRWVRDDARLRRVAQDRSDNDFEKAARRIDQEPFESKKRIFHSIRVLMFAQQILNTGGLNDFEAASDIWLDICTAPEDSESFVARFALVRQALCLT